jgi:hypothetical protein
MSAAFERAWAVLKQDVFESLGAGKYRQVSRGPDPNLAYKRPKQNVTGNLDATSIAAGRALAQMGLPFAPETPTIDPQTGGMMTTQALAPGGSMKDAWGTSGGDQDQWNETQSQFFDAMGPELGGGGMTWNERGPLLEALGAWDIRPANVGVYEGGPKVIDFENYIPLQNHPLGYGAWERSALNWANVPDEQRRTFMNLYSDRSQFDPWQDLELPGARDSWNEEWGRYLNSIRNLQFYTDLAENPEQTRLFEFGDFPENKTHVENVRREMSELRSKLMEKKRAARETV